MSSFFRFDPHNLLITTASSYKPKSFDRSGWWLATCAWVDDLGSLQFLPLSGTMQVTNAVELEVRAILEGLRATEQVELPVHVFSANQSNVDTIPSYFRVWEENSWRTKRNTQPANLDAWKQIKQFSDAKCVEWHKRDKEKIDSLPNLEDALDQISQLQRDGEFSDALRSGKLG